MKQNRQQGFTLIELSLALIVISILMLSILGVSMAVTRMYTKGITLKSVNQVSRDIGDQLTRDIRTSTPSSVMTVGNDRGRLCLGTYSYLWNAPDALAGSSYSPIITGVNTKIHLMRVFDPNGTYCTSTTSSIPASTQASALLANDSNLAVYDMTVTPFTGDTTVPIFTVHFMIGTYEDGTVLNGQCEPPSKEEANFDFCTVRQFNLVVRAGGGS